MRIFSQAAAILALSLPLLPTDASAGEAAAHTWAVHASPGSEILKEISRGASALAHGQPVAENPSIGTLTLVTDEATARAVDDYVTKMNVLLDRSVVVHVRVAAASEAAGFSGKAPNAVGTAATPTAGSTSFVDIAAMNGRDGSAKFPLDDSRTATIRLVPKILDDGKTLLSYQITIRGGHMESQTGGNVLMDNDKDKSVSIPVRFFKDFNDPTPDTIERSFILSVGGA